MPKTNYVSTENIRQNYLGVTRFESDEIICGNKFYKGDILLSNIRPYLKKVWLAEFDGICNADVLILAPQANIQSDFLYYLVANENFVTYVMSSVKGSKMPRGDKSFIMDYPVSVPDLAEQQNISCFITNLDNRILLQNKIISKYETLIKGLSIKLFNELKAEYFPLCSLCQIQKGQQINGLDLTETGKYYYLNGGIVPSGFVNSYNTEADTISISEGGNSCGFVKYNTQRFWSGGHCYTLLLSGDWCKTKFLYYYLKSIEKDIMSLRVGSGLPNIQKKSIENISIPVPDQSMQQNIIDVLDALYNKKETEEMITQLLQSQKKYLISAMFI